MHKVYIIQKKSLIMINKINIAVTGIGSLIGQAVIKSIQRSDLNDKINIIYSASKFPAEHSEIFF